MSLKTKTNGVLRNISSSTPMRIKRNDTLHNVTILRMRIGDTIYTLWELIKGWIFTSDGYAIKTNDDYMIKCNDQ